MLAIIFSLTTFFAGFNLVSAQGATSQAPVPGPCSMLEGSDHGTCATCLSGGGWWTALGCIDRNPVRAVAQLTSFLLGVAGVFVLGQILYSSFQLVVSRGDPRAAQTAKERITSSVVALLFIIFAGLILFTIASDILNIPGFFDGLGGNEP